MARDAVMAQHSPAVVALAHRPRPMGLAVARHDRRRHQSGAVGVARPLAGHAGVAVPLGLETGTDATAGLAVGRPGLAWPCLPDTGDVVGAASANGPLAGTVPAP